MDNEILRELLVSKLSITKEKSIAARNQKYEEAAVLRDQERSFEIKILDHIGHKPGWKNFMQFKNVFNNFIKKEYNCDDIDSCIEVLSRGINRQKKLDDLGI